MKKVRNGVFETNSSSSHSVTLDGELFSADSKWDDKKCFPIDDVDNKIHVALCDCEYGWGYDRFNDPWNKLQYAIMMVIETEAGQCSKIKDVYELDGFKKIQSVINTPIVIEDDTFRRETYSGGDYLEHSGYIDHQSHEDYCSLNDFLDNNDVDIVNFIFNPAVEVEISNDNM